MPTKARLIFEGDNRTQRAFSQINGDLRGLGGSVTRVAGALRGLGAILAGGFLVAAGKNSLEFADRVDKLNARLGASTEFLSQMRFAAEQTGVSFDTFALALQRMQRRVAEAAQGSGEAKDALRELGFDASKLVELSLEDQFDLIAEALNGVGTDADKTRLAMRLFDSEGVALLQTMEGGAEAVRALRAEADRLGATLTGDMAEGAAKANDAVNRISTSFRGVVDELAINFAPAIEGIANFLAYAIPKALQIGQSAFSFFAGAVARALAAVVGILQSFAAKVAEALRFFNAPGADTLQGAADSLGRFESFLTGFGETSIETAGNLFELAIGVREVSAAAGQATSSLKEMQDQVASTLGDKDLTGGSGVESLGKAITDTLGAEGENPFDNLGDQLADALTDGMIRAGEGMKDAFRNILQQLAAAMFKSALVQGLTNLGFGGLFGSFLGGKKQAGGAVTGGRAYVVGEAGPELFVPSNSGIIQPNRPGGGAGIAFNVNVDARNAAPGVGAEIERAIARARDETTAHILDLRRRGRFA